MDLAGDNTLTLRDGLYVAAEDEEPQASEAAALESITGEAAVFLVPGSSHGADLLAVDEDVRVDWFGEVGLCGRRETQLRRCSQSAKSAASRGPSRASVRWRPCVASHRFARRGVPAELPARGAGCPRAMPWAAPPARLLAGRARAR